MFAVSTLCQPIRQMYWLSYRSGSLLSWSNTGWRWWRRGKDMQPKQLAWNQSWTAWRNCYTPTRLPTRGRIRYGLHYLFSNQKHQILYKKKRVSKKGTRSIWCPFFEWHHRVILLQVIVNLSQVLDKQKEKLEKMKALTQWRIRHTEAKEEVVFIYFLR